MDGNKIYSLWTWWWLTIEAGKFLRFLSTAKQKQVKITDW
jgi:hypothetical protein